MDLDEDYVPTPTMCVEVGHRWAALDEAEPLNRQIVTVKVELPDHEVITQAWTLDTDVDTLRGHWSATFQLPRELLSITCNGDAVEDSSTLAKLGGTPNGLIVLRISSLNPSMYPIQGKQIPRKEVPPVPDVITVRVRRNNGKREDVVVEIENQAGSSVFLGGLRYKANGTELLHAQTQTYYSISPDNKLQIIEDEEPSKSDMQTATFNDSETQTLADTGCQVKPYHFNTIPPNAVVRTPRTYLNAEDSHKANIIQRNFKKWIAAQKAKRTEESSPLPEENDNDNPNAAIEKLTSQLASYKLNNASTVRFQHFRNNPTKSLMEIERLQNSRSSAAKDKLIQHILQKVSEPKTWTCSTGHTIEVDTKETLRSRQITETYEALCRTPKTPEERAETLHQLKRTLSGESGSTVKEILLLADRELDLISRGFVHNLNGLRSRLRALIRRYVNVLLSSRTI